MSVIKSHALFFDVCFLAIRNRLLAHTDSVPEITQRNCEVSTSACPRRSCSCCSTIIYFLESYIRGITASPCFLLVEPDMFAGMV
jgi:hypothetical protein